MGEKKKFALNFAAQMAVLGSQFVISFVLTPIVLAKLGDEAYGFVGLVNNFVSYVSIVTGALNSMASRFITVSYHGGRRGDTEEYYSSVFFANCIMASVVLAGSVALAMNIENLVSVAPELLSDLRLTVFIAFLNAAIGLVTVAFGVAAFIKNELFLNSVGQLAGSVLRVVLLFTLFWVASPHMWYFSVAAVSATVLTGFAQAMVTRRLLPDMRLAPSNFRPRKVAELVRVGVWTSLQQVNSLLQTGLDLLIANLFVGGAAMGLLSVAKTVPQALTSLAGNIANLFYPKMAEAYAKGDEADLVRRLSFAMRFTAGLMIVPLAGFIGFGSSFYELWLPGRNAADLAEIELLSMLTVVALLASALVEPLYYANTLTTKVKGSVLVTLGFSVAAVAVELVLLAVSDLDKLAIIAGTSSVLITVRHVIVQPFYCAKVLGVSARPFFRSIAKESAVLAFLWIGYSFVDSTVSLASWESLILCAVVAGIVGYAFVYVALFSKVERGQLGGVLMAKLVRGGHRGH